MGPSRKSEISLEAFLFLVKKMQLSREDVPDFLEENLKKILDSPLLGYFCVYVKGDNDEIVEVGVMQKFPNTISLLMNRKDALGVKIKFAKELKETVNEMEEN